MARSDLTAAEPLSIGPSILLGCGIGGFFDGIVLHQILQWHHMLSSTSYVPTSLENLQINTTADGFFHAATYLFTLGGLWWLWWHVQQQRRWTGRSLVGGLLVGWGLFNLIEGIIDHHLLQIHHVRPGPNQLWWDLGFLAWGAAMLIGGWMFIRSQQQTHA